VLKLPFAADCCPCVGKLRTVLPLTVGTRDVWCSWCPPWEQVGGSEELNRAERPTGDCSIGSSGAAALSAALPLTPCQISPLPVFNSNANKTCQHRWACGHARPPRQTPFASINKPIINNTILELTIRVMLIQ
jgi:hypothetical protein